MIGGHQEHTLSKKTTAIVRWGGVLFTVIHVFYGLLVAAGYIENPQHFSLSSAIWLGAAWLGLAWWQFSDTTDTRIRNLGQLMMYALMGGIYLLWVVGLENPLSSLWSLLIVATAMQLSWRGFWLSATIYVAFATAALMIHTPDGYLLLQSVSSVVAVLFIAYLVTLVLHQSLHDQHELDRSHAQAAMQRDRTTTLINNIADAVISTTHNGTITLYNAAALNMLDTNISLDGKNIDEILRLSDTDGNSVSLSDLLSEARAVTVRDDFLTLATGESTRLEATYAPIRRSYSGEVEEGAGYIIILRDVTKAKSLEEERDEFISVVSHELRTPITIAEGTVSNAQLMLARDNIPAEKVAAAVDVAHDQIVFLAKMVNDLSTLSRAERGVADEAEIIDINELVNDLYTEYQSEAAVKGLRLDLRLPSKAGLVNVSRLYLKELLQNFITNAIKYTNEGSVTIEVSLDKNKSVTLGVRDTGVGISKSDQRKIFGKFYRAEDYRTRETSGTGLGLYVATKLAKKLRTNIDIKSRLNHGSTFSITLPLHVDKKPKKSTKS